MICRSQIHQRFPVISNENLDIICRDAERILASNHHKGRAVNVDKQPKCPTQPIFIQEYFLLHKLYGHNKHSVTPCSVYSLTELTETLLFSCFRFKGLPTFIGYLYIKGCMVSVLPVSHKMLVTKCDRQTPSEAWHQNRWAQSAQMFQYFKILDIKYPDQKNILYKTRTSGNIAQLVQYRFS